MRTAPSLATLWDRYTRLQPHEKLVLRLRSLVYLTTTRGEFVECLKLTRQRTPTGRPWSGQNVNPIYDSLQGMGLLSESLTCPHGLAHIVAIDAAASRDAADLADAVRRQYPAKPTPLYPWQGALVNPDNLYRMLRLEVYFNDAAQFAKMRDLANGPEVGQAATMMISVLFQQVPVAADWLASRVPAIQAELLTARLSGYLLFGGDPSEVTDLLPIARDKQDQPGFEPVPPVLRRYDVLAGHRDRLDQAADVLGDTADGSAQALAATSAFLAGDNDAALGLYRDSLKRYRKSLGKRKVFLADEHGVFFLMALLAANDPALHPEIQTGLEAALSASERASRDGALQAVLVMFWLLQGMEAKAREAVEKLWASTPTPPPLAGACIALARHAVDPQLSRSVHRDLVVRFDKARELLPLVARMYAEILAASAPSPVAYKVWLDENPGPSFTALIKTKLPWERALASLDALLSGGDGKAAGASHAQRPAKRLAWFVDPGSQEVTAVEQSARARDGWTDGRPVAMKRLHEQDAKLDYLTPQDRLALRTIKKYASGGYYGDPETYEFDAPRTIAALVGHPTVFDVNHRSQSLELVSYPVELLVTEAKGGYRIALSHRAEAGAVFLEPETPSRYRVIVFPQKLMAVQELLGKDGLTVPAAARDQVIEMVRRNNPALPIRAEIAEIEQPGIEADATPVVQLLPLGEGVRLTLVVRPFGSGGPAYIAGLGGRSVLATIEGQQVRANRDLPAELAQRAALVDACPTLRDRAGENPHILDVEDLEGSLELLLELQSYAGPLAIEWPEGKKLKVHAVIPAKFKIRVGEDRNWFSVDGSVGLDEDQVLEMRYLLDRLDKAQGRFVSLGDGRFVALTRQMQSQLQKLAAVSEPHKDGRRVHKLAAGALGDLLDGAGEVTVDAAWKKHVAKIKAAEGWTPAVPSGLQAELRDYQVEGFVWMSRLARWGAGACLADDMGLGKTVQTIAVMLDRAEQGPCLVVAPTSVGPNWENEIARFAPTLRTYRFASVGDRAGLVASLGPRDVLICTYGLLGDSLADRDWQMIVLDEAQAIKNAETKRAQAVQALSGGFRLALSGTPVENHLDEIWSLFSFVNPGVLGSKENFQRRFSGPIEATKDPHARQALRALIKPFLLRRTKALVLTELPPRTEQTLNVEMTEHERAFYEAMRQRSIERIAAMDGPPGQKRIQILAEITRLRRACCNPALIDAKAGVPSGKLGAFLELVGELVENKHRALVFSQFVGHLDLVRAALDAKGIRYEYLDGSTPASEREKRVARFQAGGADLFLISLKAGGTGLNLTAADYVVHLDPWWNPAVEDQASDRAHRIGQERPVTVYRLIMQDSIEERILALHKDKRDMAADLLDGAESTGRLSEDALLDLIRG